MAIQQTGTVAKYRHRFEAIVALLIKENEEIEEILSATFLNGLRSELKANVTSPTQ